MEIEILNPVLAFRGISDDDEAKQDEIDLKDDDELEDDDDDLSDDDAADDKEEPDNTGSIEE